jgi:hypothetical protein
LVACQGVVGIREFLGVGKEGERKLPEALDFVVPLTGIEPVRESPPEGF